MEVSDTRRLRALDDKNRKREEPRAEIKLVVGALA